MDVLNIFFLICAVLVINMIIQLIRYAAKFPKEEPLENVDPQKSVYGTFGGLGKATLYYTGDIRYIDGKPIKTADEWEEWKVLKGLSIALSETMMDIEHRIEDGLCNDVSLEMSKWEKYYDRYRKLCIKHKLWNTMIGEHTPFIPTETQLIKEKELYHKMENLCEKGKKKLEDYIAIKEAILSDKRIGSQAVARKIIVNSLADNNADRKKDYRNACSRMVREGLLVEGHNEKGELTIKKKRVYKKKTPTLEAQNPSVFIHEKYENVSYRTLCKIKHTVGSPYNVDRANNTCIFESLSREATYYTSLSSCTCPAFSNKDGVPCKHMVALAKYLGYMK